jgi:DNA-binding response OmpR family regulator
LIVEDEARMAALIKRGLEEDGYVVDVACTGPEALWQATEFTYDAVVLDRMLPGLDGVEVCRRLRAGHRWMPVLMLTARSSVDDRVLGLDAGADDYLTKPFSTLELQARARALLRRAAQGAGTGVGAERLVIGALEINLAHRTVHRAGEEVHLTPTEWGLLRAFVTHRGRTLTHQQLFRAVWGRAEGDAQQYLRVYVGQLRRKLEVDPVRPTLITTEPAVGYRFDVSS